MNANNQSKLSHLVEEAVGKVISILNYNDQNQIETLLCPMITLKALFKQLSELVALLPPIHRSPFYDEVQYASQSFLKWIGEWPDILLWTQVQKDPDFKRLAKRFQRIAGKAYLIPKEYKSPPPAIFGIEYQTNHTLHTYAINKTQERRMEDISAEVAQEQFSKMADVKRRIAVDNGEEISSLMLSGPNGLALPYIYMEDKDIIQKFAQKSEWKDIHIEADRLLQKIIANGKNSIPPIIIRVREDDLDEEPPKKMVCLEDDMTF